MKTRLMRWIYWVSVLALSVGVFAQTAQKAAPAADQGIPRTADGKPDLSGTWVGGGGGGGFDNVTGQPMQLTDWGMDKLTWNKEPASKTGFERARVDQDPVYHCYPPGLVRIGPPRNTVGNGGSSVEILETPGKVIIVYQYRNSIRYIYTDGREHPKNVEATWNGHSIGKWDGDTFVVDSVGLRDESWIDSAGHEHSDQLHVVERFRRLDARNLEVERTLTDPVALAKPFVRRYVLKLNPNYDLNENMDGKQYDCGQFMVRKPAFGEGEGGLLGIGDHKSIRCRSRGCDSGTN